ncbi:MAG: alpha-amylase/4-alpha-glucanotransferase domain-containing protein, partial [Pseudomonadota bacterium]
ALHFHQPVGNFDSVFESATARCYRPVLEHFARHPKVPAAFHLSGCLLEWLEKHDRKFLNDLFRLVGSGQIEPLGGGFFEPILSVIPKSDALEQLARLSEYWVRNTGIRPKGVWLTERVWEPSLAELLAEAGVGYTVLDDHHLRLAGFLDQRFSGLYATERNGKGVGFFPSDFQLRYLIPFRTIPVLREHFANFAGDAREWVLTYGDDAEKFGFWPGTHKWVFEEKWLEQFLSLLEEPDGPVRPQAPGDYFSERPPCRKVYIPNASYTEMLEWALPPTSVAGYSRTRSVAMERVPAEDVHAFVRGSLWDMFLCRYPESDQMHKHALFTSRNAHALSDKNHSRERAVTSALRGQCNCPYWHGLFGGIYLPHLRHGVYSSILDADALLAEADADRPRALRMDYDGDLHDEVILLGKSVQAFFRPADAGTLVELDYLPARFNLTNLVSRWKESYHEGTDLTHQNKMTGGVASPHERSVGILREDLKNAYFDRLPMRSFRDFVSAECPTPETLERFSGMALAEGTPSSWSVSARSWTGSFSTGGVSYERTAELDASDRLVVRWKIPPARDARGFFGTLLAFSLLTPDAPDRGLLIQAKGRDSSAGPPGRRVRASGVTALVFEDRAFGFSCEVAGDIPFELAATPIHTLARSEEGYERAYQGTLLSLAWPAGQENVSLTVSLRKLSS